jgi:hypothetical protein
MRKNYDMLPEDLAKIKEACKPEPLIVLQCGMPRSLQERANSAWKELGERMGFDHMTVRPRSGSERFFSAEETIHPTESRSLS